MRLGGHLWSRCNRGWHPSYLTRGKAVETAEIVVRQGLTVHRILDDRIVPVTLDREAARAIYGAPPGQPFPITLRP